VRLVGFVSAINNRSCNICKGYVVRVITLSFNRLWSRDWRKFI